MKKLWESVSSTGSGFYRSSFDRKSVTLTNRICFILCCFVLTSILINLSLDSFVFIIPLCIAFAALLLCYYLNSKGLFTWAKVNMLLTILVLLSYMCLKAGGGSGLELYFLSSTVLPFIIFRNNRIIYFFQLLIVLCLIWQRFYAPEVMQKPLVYDVFYIVNSVYSAIFIILSILFFRDINRRHEKELIEKAKIIQEKNRELELINKELDAFTYSVSHDLHAPLRSIDGFSKLLEHKYASVLNEEALEFLGRIRGGTMRMRNLIDELLVLSQAGKALLKLSPVDTAELVKGCITELREQINPDGEIITGQLPEVFADTVLLSQVFMNLISNAIKYSSKKEHQRIEIGCREEEEYYVFCVRDNGAGFDMQYSDKLFKIFQRLHNAEEFEGTGVGLAIIQSIISKHNGKVWAESELDKGATFYFSLPKRPA